MARFILRDAYLLDSDTAGRHATVVVSGERIESVGPAPVDPGPQDRVIDCTGKTVMPGMVLGHFHAAYWGTGVGGRPVGLEAHHSARIALLQDRTKLLATMKGGQLLKDELGRRDTG